MKKVVLSLTLLFGLFTTSYAQEDNNSVYVVEEGVNNFNNPLNYNKWSIEFQGGANKATTPFTDGYFNETPSFYNANFGIRYMFNPKFGLKLSGGYDRLKEGKNSKRFRSNFYRVDLSGVANLGRIMNFETWTNTFGLLGHAGVGYGFMNNDATKGDTSGLLDDQDEMGLVSFGLTPQMKLSNRVVLTGDLSYTKTIRQNTAWDGQSSDAHARRGFDGTLWNATLGLTFYLGKNDIHADWVADDTSLLANRVSAIEEMLKDSDGDGVADYLDLEPNSAPGAVVDTRGRTIDHNGNGIPDDIEEYIKNNQGSNTTTVLADSDLLEQLINSGIINVYFDYNVDQPYEASVGGIKFVSEYLKRNPNVQMDVIGYADPVGSDGFNKNLSQRRAENVKRILVQQGANANNLNVVAMGEDKSFQNSTVSAHQLARRVIFKIKK
ncbi:OmpA family protein [Weeksella virosa]|uniref:OmpA/MotB domain protein n=1 Tax=Weeksella virosa (strain ATCC 43766 / DSM 16922 / JCM 21250 / CCUG 30538 / CDC 9751 / IAM 14551 / NBRC 16016 / NCTC 11634 / CL345/78) TaxID=865938 RepID=F0P195_WEEVC|nr:OmpA family protein [Weeksella virosa]ADX67594.1 OmpA/MotB domain protein [Weeksella virosa DSM 16922]MDK7676122.1 OmpA family protein [Weeksella virosa]SUP53895.1 Outer membrane porin F precursor [Weeksella virosa]VEH64782.1 Outer membrane porin F precursor [Weeksella virosa]